MLSREQLNQTVYDKKSYYKAMVRNKYFMPHQNENIVTLKFMKDVRAGKIWLPKTKEITPIKLPDPPPRQKVADEFHKIAGNLIANRKVYP